MLSIGAFFVGGQARSDQTPPAATAAQRGSTQLDPLPQTDGGVAIGGPDLAGQRYEGTDPRTGVSAAVGLEKKGFGTQISFAISNITGPKVCRLLAVHTDGTSEPLVSWTVGTQGWGTAANPEPLLLQAVTATPREDIAHIQVQEVAANGSTDTLVRVP